jgi:hypothetical protein
MRRTSSLYFEPFPFPTSFGYRRMHATQEGAECAVGNSRTAFVILGALSSYEMVVSASSLEELTEPAPRWVRCLHQSHVHHTWIKSFRHPDLHWLDEVEHFARASVPFWVEWGDGKDRAIYDRKAPFLQHLHPMQILSMSIDASEVALQFPLSNNRPESPPPVSDAATYSEKHLRSSLQHEGETWKEFFNRQLLALERVKKSETPRQCQSREGRELSSKTWFPSSKSGPLVFNWVEEDGDWLQIPLTRSETPDFWDTCRSSTCFFFSHLNQWDLFPESVTDPSLDSSDDGHWSNDPDAPDAPGGDHVPCALDNGETPELPNPDTALPLPPPPYVLEAQKSTDTWVHDVALGYHHLPTPGISLPAHHNLDVILYSRYGFSPNREYQPSQSEGTSVAWVSQISIVYLILRHIRTLPRHVLSTIVFAYSFRSY